MTAQAEALLQAALALADTDRAHIAAELLASLDAPAADEHGTVQALWAEELERRAKRVLPGD